MTQIFSFTGYEDNASDWLKLVDKIVTMRDKDRAKIDIFTSKLFVDSPADVWYTSIPVQIRRHWSMVRELFGLKWVEKTEQKKIDARMEAFRQELDPVWTGCACLDMLFIEMLPPPLPVPIVLDRVLLYELIASSDVDGIATLFAQMNGTEHEYLARLWKLAFNAGKKFNTTPPPPATSYDDSSNSTPLATSQNQPKSPKQPIFEPKQPISSPKPPQQRVFEPQSPVSTPKSHNQCVLDPHTPVFDSQTTVSSPKSPQRRVFDPQPPVLIPNDPTTPPTPFNWADDAASLPILTSRLPPRNLSVLRSSSLTPFSSLQRRNKRAQTPFSRHSNNYIPSPTPRQTFSHRHLPMPHISSIPPRLAQVYPRFSPTPALNWEADPRLSELSHALKALGWIRAF
jgi:hypothetical protein